MNIKSFGKGNLKNIEKIEKNLKIKLPDDYKNFLIECNGAVIEDAYIYVDDLKQKMMMGLIYGVDTKKASDILKINKEFEDDILKNSILIGTDAGEGWILLICDGKNDGIWYYDHSYFFEQSTDDLNTYFICDTFSDFIKMLETTIPAEEDDDDNDEMTDELIGENTLQESKTPQQLLVEERIKRGKRLGGYILLDPD